MATSRSFATVVGRRLLSPPQKSAARISPLKGPRRLGAALRLLGSLTAGICLGAAALSAAAAGYQTLAIVSPSDQSTIHDNQGRMRIDAALAPPLSADAGDRFVFIVDGVPMLPSRSSSLSMEQMERGSHTLQVQVVDAAGNPIISSPTTTVYIWHASALLPHPSRP